MPRCPFWAGMSPSRSSPAARSPTPPSTTPPAPPPSSGSGTTWPRTRPTTAACTAAPATSRSSPPTSSRTARRTVAEFLDCRADDQVVFTRSTTDSLNLLAAALPAGCQVFVFETEHHASLLPWQRRPGHATSTPRAPRSRPSPPWSRRSPPATPTARPWSASPAPRTSPASCGRCGSWPPPPTPTAPGSSWTPRSSPRTTRCPSRDLDVDWVAFSGHKLYAPFGSGVLAGRADWLRAADPYLAGRRRQPQGHPARGRRRGRGVARQRRPARGRLAERHRRLLDRLRLQGAHRGRVRQRWSPASST